MTNKLKIARQPGRPAGRPRKPRGKDRSEIITMRLTPRLRYLLELMARSQRRTTSSMLEWMVEQHTSTFMLQRPPQAPVALADVADILWHPDASVRLDQLARLFPALLTYDEHLTWAESQPTRTKKEAKDKV